jgi:hypothetical protein
VAQRCKTGNDRAGNSPDIQARWFQDRASVGKEWWLGSAHGQQWLRAALAFGMLSLASAGLAAPPPAGPAGPSTAWRRMAVAPGEPVTMRPEPPRQGRKRCIDMRAVASARQYGERALELRMRGGRHFRLFLAQECPALAFYQGFYYRPSNNGQLCAGKDVIGARSGGECQISSILQIGHEKH